MKRQHQTETLSLPPHGFSFQFQVARKLLDSQPSGVVAVLLEALTRLGLEPKGATASIQGFGNVAQHAAKRFVRSGGTLIAVSSWDAGDRQAYTLRKASGVDPGDLSQLTDRFGTINRLEAAGRGYEVLPGSAWLEQDVDVLVPAALENQITAANAPRIHGRVRVIAEAANKPTTSDASMAFWARAPRRRGWPKTG